jgi:hypothetical protein
MEDIADHLHSIARNIDCISAPDLDVSGLEERLDDLVEVMGCKR